MLKYKCVDTKFFESKLQFLALCCDGAIMENRMLFGSFFISLWLFVEMNTLFYNLFHTFVLITYLQQFQQHANAPPNASVERTRKPAFPPPPPPWKHARQYARQHAKRLSFSSIPSWRWDCWLWRRDSSLLVCCSTSLMKKLGNLGWKLDPFWT